MVSQGLRHQYKRHFDGQAPIKPEQERQVGAHPHIEDQTLHHQQQDQKRHDPQHAADGETFSVQEVECLGGCVNAPVVQINDDFYEDLDEASMQKVLDAFRRGETPKPGPQVDRQTSAPEGGPLTLKGE